MGGTGVPVVDSFRCLVELIQYCKVKNKIKLKKNYNHIDYILYSVCCIPMTSLFYN